MNIMYLIVFVVILKLFNSVFKRNNLNKKQIHIKSNIEVDIIDINSSIEIQKEFGTNKWVNPLIEMPKELGENKWLNPPDEFVKKWKNAKHYEIETYEL